MELSKPSSSKGGSTSRPSLNYRNRSQHKSGSQKAVGPGREWKPKPMNSNAALPSEKVAMTVANEAGVESVPVLSESASGDAIVPLQKRLEEVHISESQNVIIPTHLRVANSERSGFSFGTFEAGFSITSCIGGRAEKSFTGLSSNQETPEDALEGDNSEDNVSFSAVLDHDQPKSVNCKDLKIWNTALADIEDHRNMMVHPQINDLLGFPPFTELIPDHFIHDGVIEPGLCLFYNKEDVRKVQYISREWSTMEIIVCEDPPKPYDRVSTDGAYTKDVSASYAAVASKFANLKDGEMAGQCNGYSLGWTEELVPSPAFHELVGAVHGLELGKTLGIEYLELVLDNQDAGKLIQFALPQPEAESVDREKKYQDLMDSICYPKGSKFHPKKILPASPHGLPSLAGSSLDIEEASGLPSLAENCFVEYRSVKDRKKDRKLVKQKLEEEKYADRRRAWLKEQDEQERDAVEKRAKYIRTSVERVLVDVRKLIYENWIDEAGKVKIIIKTVLREANYSVDSLTHMVALFVEPGNFKVFTRFPWQPDFFIPSLRYFGLRNQLSYYVRFRGGFDFLTAKYSHFYSARHGLDIRRRPVCPFRFGGGATYKGNGGNKKPCMYFNSYRGCRKGANCRFLHW